MKKESKKKEKQPGEDWSDIYGFIKSLGIFSLAIIAMISYVIIFFNIADF